MRDNLQEIDYDKVETVEDIVALLKTIYPNVKVSDGRTELVKHLLKESNNEK